MENLNDATDDINKLETELDVSYVFFMYFFFTLHNIYMYMYNAYWTNTLI